jgi:hypothetical protein
MFSSRKYGALASTWNSWMRRRSEDQKSSKIFTSSFQGTCLHPSDRSLLLRIWK